ncbi:hypothetical protein GQX74_008976 [Glossina fuscipes]|nr:hypothetical protein GQX74_008976 [Glossina fuscipes]
MKATLLSNPGNHAAAMNFSKDNGNNQIVTNNEASQECITSYELEKREEEKLKAKYPILRNSNVNNIMVMKRLHKGQKYFDSGDYQMAKQKGRDISQLLPNIVTGDIIPTIENLRVRKSSIIQGKCFVKHRTKATTPMFTNITYIQIVGSEVVCDIQRLAMVEYYLLRGSFQMVHRADLILFGDKFFVIIQCFSCQYLLNHPQDYLHLRFHDGNPPVPEIRMHDERPTGVFLTIVGEV